MGFKKLIGSGVGAGLGSLVGLGPSGSLVGGLIGSHPDSLNSIGDFLTGKKYGPDDIAGELKQTALQASLAQRQGLSALTAQNPGQLAESQIAQGQGALKANIEDSRRQIQQNIARQGLKNTSIGQVAENAATRNGQLQLSQLLASRPQLERQNAKELINAGAQVSGAQSVPIDFQGGRKPGALSLLTGIGGAALGAQYGGPQGAAAGYGVGTGAGQGLQSIFG